MTVADMRERMSNSEYLMWCVYHQRRAQQNEIEARKAR